MRDDRRGDGDRDLDEHRHGEPVDQEAEAQDERGEDEQPRAEAFEFVHQPPASRREKPVDSVVVRRLEDASVRKADSAGDGADP